MLYMNNFNYFVFVLPTRTTGATWWTEKFHRLGDDALSLLTDRCFFCRDAEEQLLMGKKANGLAQLFLSPSTHHKRAATPFTHCIPPQENLQGVGHILQLELHQ